MEESSIEGWAPQLHFLLVEIQGKEMRITPKSFAPVAVMNRAGRRITMPLRVTLP
jgi:hypothetical protein